MLKGIKIRIYPTDEQIGFINRQLGCCRLVYNCSLDYRKNSYENKGESVSGNDAVKNLVLLKTEYPFLRDVHSKVLQQSVRDLNTAYENFFKKKLGYPKFKSKHDNNQSCRFPKDAFIGINGNRISLIKSLKDILFKCSRRDEKYLNKRQDHIHSITLTKTCSGKYYLSILIDYQSETRKHGDGIIGIDLGVKSFYTDSNNNVIKNKHFYTRNEKKIKCLNRSLSRKQKGSNNRNKTRVKLAKIYEKISNQRHDYIQKLTSRLIDENQVICVEDLNVKGMLKNHKLAKHVQECGFGEFIVTLEYKCQMYGVRLVKVGRWYSSSKTCHGCGHVKKDLKLSDRKWVCPKCGSVTDRDYNAAMNIRDEGIRIIGSSSPEYKPVENPTVDDRSLNLRSSGSVKQEKNEFYNLP